jgi:two-component system, NtrC family, sensor kinase
MQPSAEPKTKLLGGASLRWIISGVGLAVLAAGWVALFAGSRVVDADRQAATLAKLKEVSRQDADWTADVLRSDADINRTYDPLTRPIPLVQSLLNELEAEARRLNDADAIRSVEALWSVFDTKVGLIDQFKAGNSLLKNSLRYTPTANSEIQALMRAQRDAGLAEGTRLVRDVPGAFENLERAVARAGGAGEGLQDGTVAKAMAQLRATVTRSRQADRATQGALSYVTVEGAVSTLISDTLSFAAAPESASRDAIKTGIDQVRSSTQGLSAPVREAVGNTLRHVEAILSLRVSQRELLSEISRVPVAPAIDALNTALNRRFEAELHQQSLYNRALLAFSALVLLLVFGAASVLAWRLVTERRRLEVQVAQQTRELRENEAQLAHAQRMSTLGETVAGIAHEINTPLAAAKSGMQSTRDLLGTVKDYIQESSRLHELLAQPTPSDETARAERNAVLGRLLRHTRQLQDELGSVAALESLDELSAQSLASIDHIHQVVLNMLDYSRVDRARIATMPIEEAVERTLKMAGHLLKRVKLVKDFGKTTPIAIDVAQINQVILNLVKNAAQAVPAEGGEVRIRTTMRDADHVQLIINDNGAGIPADVLPKIWEPFFTTKKAGAGTGLGLSTSKRIVDAHKGRLEVRSVVGQGTAFTLELPTLSPMAASISSAAQSPASGFPRAAVA